MKLLKKLYWNLSITRWLLNLIKHSYFKKHLNPVFIETGSFKGDGIRAALKAGFEKVISMEPKGLYYFHCVNRFQNIGNVELYWNYSNVLIFILNDIFKRCTFWLDAHDSGIDNSPLIRELQIIKDHHIKDHTIIIDDIRLYKDRKDQIEKILYSINPDYKIRYKFGVTFNDILIAEI